MVEYLPVWQIISAPRVNLETFGYRKGPWQALLSLQAGSTLGAGASMTKVDVSPKAILTLGLAESKSSQVLPYPSRCG